MKILEALVLVLLFFIPLGELARVDFGNDLVFKALDLVSAALFLTWLLMCIYKREFPSQAKLVSIFPIIGLLSLSLNSLWLKPTELLISSFYLIRWVSYASLFVIVSGFDKGFKKIISYCLFIGGLFIVVAGYAQYFFYPDLHPLFYLGWDIHMYRMFSTFLDPNFTGAFLVLYGLFVSGLILQEVRRGRFKISVFLMGILVLTFVAVFLTFSRSALVMLVVGFVVFLILIKRKRLIFVVLAAILLFAIIASPKFNVENINLFREASSKARLDNYSLALKLALDRPILGVGFNSYRYAKRSYGIASGWTNAPSHADAGVDNSFLFVLVTTGILGLSAYLWMWIGILQRAFRLYRYKLNIWPVVVVSSIISLFINSFFINSLFYSAIMFWVWIFVGLMWERKDD